MRLCATPRAKHTALTHTPRTTRTRHIVRAFSGQPSPFDDFTRRALDEAVSLYQDAVQQAEQQTRAELLQSLQSEPAADTNSGPAPTIEALSAFWLEQGLKEWQIQRVVKELQQDPSTANLSVSALAARVATLQRVLPAANVAQMVYQQYTVLQLDSTTVVQALVHLVQHLPGRDVVDMVRRQPKLLLLEDLPQRLPRVVAKLQQLHPSGSERVVQGLIAEHPDLLLRVPYYLDASLLDDLPIELQNMMVLADQGLGFLYRYYKAGSGGADAQGAASIGLDDELET